MFCQIVQESVGSKIVEVKKNAGQKSSRTVGKKFKILVFDTGLSVWQQS